jgi:hypothetical protein
VFFVLYLAQMGHCKFSGFGILSTMLGDYEVESKTIELNGQGREFPSFERPKGRSLATLRDDAGGRGQF